MNYIIKLIGIALLTLSIISCGHETKTKTSAIKNNSYEIKPQSVHKTLHFTGTVQPLKESTLTSPMEAVVDTMDFHYGQLVKKGDVILVLNSNELQKQYNDTLTEYLKAKDSYSISKAKFLGTQELWDSGLISKNNYLSEKSGLDTARVTLMQETRKFTELMEKMHEDNTQNLSELSLSDFGKVKKILASNHNLIYLKSPSDGVMLYPPKSGDDKSTRLSVGTTVKSGQVLALIGNLKGIRVEIDVAEVDIDKIRVGMDATVCGVAFGGNKLKGKLVAINAQASNTATGGLPSFSAVIEVNSLTPEQQLLIKVGMSAVIELNTASENQLLVPIAAVKREKGNSIVYVQLAKNSTEKRVITTGPAQADSVIVETGLKAGDVVVYD